MSTALSSTSIHQSQVAEAEILRCDAFFRLLGNRLTEALVQRKRVASFRRNDFVCTGREEGGKFGFVQSGSIKSMYYLSDGRELVIDSVLPGAVFGEINALRDSKISFESRALEDTVCWFFDGGLVREALRTDPLLATKILQHVLAKMSDLEARLVSQAESSLSARLASTLVRLAVSGANGVAIPGTHIHISQQELASMLPASREKVNRCLGAWRRAEIIDVRPGLILIKDVQALKSCAHL